MTSRRDQIEPKVIENGVIVPPGLQINEMTLAEHNDFLVWCKQHRRLTRGEAVQAGHRPDEIAEVYGAESL